MLYFLLGDHLGSTSITATSSGGFYSELRYMPWGGNRYSSPNSTPTTFRYTGQREAEVGLYFYGARFYDPALGRFISPDTVIPQGQGSQAWDRYAGMNNDPVRYTDPTGHGVDLGTRIGRNTLSSHDHFEDGTYNLSLEGAPNREFTDANGTTTVENGPGFGVAHYPRFESTEFIVPSLITTGASISPIANSSTFSNVTEGTKVSIAYWDEEGRRYVERGFNVGDINSRQIIFNDPLGFITHGDSKGPIYFEGELIGHVDQINQGIVIDFWLPGSVVNPGYSHHGR